MARKYPDIARLRLEDTELINPRKLSDPNWRPELQHARRRVNLNFMGISLAGETTVKKLEKILYVADREFEHVAELCDASVIPHTWAILESDTKVILAAEVPRIPVITDPSMNNRLKDGVDKYNRLRRWLPWGLADIACRQFVTSPTGADGQSIDVLCDIDPLFRRPMSLA